MTPDGKEEDKVKDLFAAARTAVAAHRQSIEDDEAEADIVHQATSSLGKAEMDRMRRRRESAEQIGANLISYEQSRAKPEDHSHAVLKEYVRLSNNVYKIVKSQRFDHFIMSVILAASMIVSLETYDSLEGNKIIEILNLVILAIFTAEVILKLVAEALKPWLYFCGAQRAWNTFDFVIVVMSYTLAGSSIAALRLLRLCRLVKIVNKVPKLRTLLEGLGAGLGQIGYIALLMVLIFYIFALLGILLFRNNDPTHWSNLGVALTTLFRCATLEDWTDVYYINFFGCDHYNNAGAYDTLISNPADGVTPCATPEATPVTATVFFFLFIVVSSMVLLSMFIGAITISMSDCVARLNMEDQARKLIKQKKQESALKQQMGKSSKWENVKRRVSNIATEPLTNAAQSKRKSKMSKGNSVRGVAAGGHQLYKNINGSVHQLFHRHVNKTLTIAEQNNQARLNALVEECFTGIQNKPVVKKESTPARRAFADVAKICQKIAKSFVFQTFILLVITLTAVMVGLATMDELAAKSWYNSLTTFWDSFARFSFTLELVIRVLAEGFNPSYYFFARGSILQPIGWNWFDALVVAGSWAPGSGDVVIVLRLLRLLTVFKLITKFPKMRLAVDALINGLTSIGYVGILLTATFYFFAIFAIILFKSNDPWHFGNLHLGMITLFRMATLEDWTDVMYINKYGCDKWLGYRKNNLECKDPKAHGYSAVIFFVFFTVFGSLIMLNLFIGVIVTSMEEALNDLDTETDTKRKVKGLVKQYEISKLQLKQMTEAYKMLSNGKNEIETEELRGCLQDAGVKLTELKMNEIMKIVDSDYDGTVTFVEFINFAALMSKTKGSISMIKKLHVGSLTQTKPKDPPEIEQLKFFEEKENRKLCSLEFELVAFSKFYGLPPPAISRKSSFARRRSSTALGPSPTPSRAPSPRASSQSPSPLPTRFSAGTDIEREKKLQPTEPPPVLRPTEPPPARMPEQNNPMRKSLWELEPHELEDTDSRIKILI